MHIITTRPHSRRTSTIMLGVAAVGVLALASCGSGSSTGAASSGAATTSSTQSGSAASSGMTVTVRDVSGHQNVLATADGHTLYETMQEKGAVLCKSSACTAVWVPLTVPAGQTPTGPSQISGMLTTIKRPDGKTQVAIDGKPLYTFSFDNGAGQLGGDGKQDSFDGTNFTWELATVPGTAPAPSSPMSSSSTSGGGYSY